MIIIKILISFLLVALCVTTHAIGITLLLRISDHASGPSPSRFWVPAWHLIRVAGWLIVLHFFHIFLWAIYYLLHQAMPDLSTAMYFSSVTYTTVGYGDLLLPNDMRLVGGVEALTGILMCGWSAGFFFAVVNRMYQGRQGTLGEK